MIGFFARLFYRMVGGNTTIPVTLGLRNIYILPTGYGLLYLTGLTGMLIGSINYNNNLGFLLTFLLGSLGITAMLHTYGMLYGIRLFSAVATPVFAGEFMDVEIRVAGVKRSRTALRWFFRPYHPVVVNVSPETPMQVRVSAKALKRGWFLPPRLRIDCVYPLGLFRAWVRINTDVRCVVYPKPLAAPVPKTEGTADNEREGTISVTGTDDFIGLAAYRPGDPLRRIHWQAYSRGRGLFIKQFAGQASRAIMLDMQQMKGRDVEKRLSVLCFHVLTAHRRRQYFGLKLMGQVIPPDSGRAHRDRCLRALALFQRQ
ncbi:conserved uncharacterized protein, DUF58 [Desulfosarcina variabilis str. Montpellier]|uniref:DUF58 domain-containing protein n=1 Tax=Desulfosarcina variabilis TaxID=2300 RepID=UPI003AFA05FD